METELLIITAGQKTISFVMLAFFFMLTMQKMAASTEIKPQSVTESLQFSDTFAQRSFLFTITPVSLVIYTQIPIMETIGVEVRDKNDELVLKTEWPANSNELNADCKGLLEKEYVILLHDSCSNKKLNFNVKD
jgi:hypothetical protein